MTTEIILLFIAISYIIFSCWRAYHWWASTPGKPKLKRSNQWPTVRKKHLEMEPTCQACGTKKKLTVHHVLPFHEHPQLELDHSNLITLCEEHHCHLIFGHLCSWYSYNTTVRADVKWFLEKVKKRP
jgi:5-methylcytosine-specific restriction enzyme A